MLSLFPKLKVNETYSLPVGDGHVLYVEESGNAQGIPVLVVNGGPGEGSDEFIRRLFDAERFRVIQFDQRGCGRSQPLAEIESNNTEHTLGDIQKVCELLDIDKVVLFGTGWGAGLSLLYAARRPNSVRSILLCGAFLGRPLDTGWLFGLGAQKVFPDYWVEFAGKMATAPYGELLEYFYSQLLNENELKQIQCAKKWAAWMAKISTWHPNQDLLRRFTHPHVAISLARVGCHYYKNNCFLEIDQLLTEIKSISKIPTILIHGRYDMVAPLQGAVTVCNQLDACELKIVRNAGHSVREPAMVDAVIHASQSIGERLSPVLG